MHRRAERTALVCGSAAGIGVAATDLRFSIWKRAQGTTAALSAIATTSQAQHHFLILQRLVVFGEIAYMVVAHSYLRPIRMVPASDLARSYRMKVLLVDDHVLVREAMRGILRELDSAAVSLEAESGQQAKDLLVRHPDVSLILLDLRLPDRDGLGMLAELRASHPAIAVVMLSAFNDRDNVVKSLDAGAQGFIAKTASRDVLLSALRLVLAGGIYIPPEILTTVATPLAQPPKTTGLESRLQPQDLGLTDRQMDVLALMMQGKSNKLICRQLDLAEPTVKNHVSAILKALNVSNRTEAVLAVAALGWTPPTKSIK